MRSTATVACKAQTIEEFNLSLNDLGWESSFMPLQAAPGPARLVGAQGERVSLVHVELTGRIHQRAGIADEALTFGVPSQPQAPIGWSEHTIPSETITCFHDRVETISEARFAAFALSIPRDRLDCASSRASDANKGFPAGTRVLPDAVIAPLRLQLTTVLEQQFDPRLSAATRSGLFRNFERIAAELAESAWNTGRADPRVARRAGTARVLRRALEFLHAHPKTPVPIADLCRQVCCSQRTLERAFRSSFDVTPKRYSNHLRLCGVQREIIRSKGRRPVGDVAAEWGFWHLSEFAYRYRQLFGERPSETRARVTGRLCDVSPRSAAAENGNRCRTPR